MSLLYDIFVYPLEFIMEIVLSHSLNAVGNPLFSLVILSIVVSVGSLPVYHIAEKWQDRERSIQKKLKPKIDEFKSIFKGAALNTYLNTLYKQNNYHPIHAVRTSLGLLIQIPFFFAAYHLLSNNANFNGVPVFVFRDLGKPDELIKIGSLIINVLPFIMTGANLISAAVYSRKTVRSEKIQLYGIAVLFLILLYNASSALLIYWTCNNLFSFFKNLAYNRIYSSGIIKDENPEKSSVIRQYFAKIYLKRPDGWVQLTLVLLSVLAYLSVYNNTGPVFKNSLPVIAITFLPAVTVFFFILLSLSRKDHFRNVLAVFPVSDKETDKVFRLSIYSFSLLAFISVPMAVLSSGSEADFEGSLNYFVTYMAVFAAIFTVLLLFIYSSLNERVKWLVSLVTVSLVLFSLVNVFIFAGSYGDMSHFVFNEDIEIHKVEIIINLFAGFLVFAFILFVFLTRRYSIVKSVFVIIIVSLIIFTFNEAKTFSEKRSKNENNFIAAGNTGYTFSKKGKNVIIIMLDRFIGGYMPKIIELMPELKKDLDGFVLYKNSLSPASYTLGGVPAILGGWDYTVRTVNTERTDVPLRKKLDESSRIMPYNFDKAGFDVTVFQNDFINWSDKVSWLDSKNRENLGDSVFISTDYPKLRDMWLEKYEKNIRKEDNSIRKKLLAFGLFRSAPLFLREYIYNNGEWHLEEDDEPDYVKPDDRKFVSFVEKSKYKRDTTLKYYASLDFLPDLSKASEEADSQFIYIANNMTHEPHNINAKFEYEISGRVSYPRNIYDRFNKNLNSLKHLYADGAAIRLVNEWLQWMKQNNVYDNTRIIIVSDHGRDVYNPFFKQQKIPGGRARNHPAYFNNLFLFKDFDFRGELAVNEEFMSSADVPAVAMQNLIDGINPYTGTKIMSPENKFPFNVYDIQWRIEKQTEFKYIYHEAYEISEKSDVSNPGKWKVIQGNK